MEKSVAGGALAAMAKENRLDVFRLLVQAGADGLPAGEIENALGLAPNTLSFHFDRLRQAELVSVKRQGRSMIYAARYDGMNGLIGYLTENCCRGADARGGRGCNPVGPHALVPRRDERDRNARSDRRPQ